MTKFARWSGIVHSVLAKSYRKVKLGHSRELLSAYFGHRTYASLRVHDLAVLEDRAKYVLINRKMALERASSMSLPLADDIWREAEMALKPSGVSGDTWLVDEQNMRLAAELTFRDSLDPNLRNISQSIGRSEGRQVTRIRCHSIPGEFPNELQFTVDGEVLAFNENAHLAIPIECKVNFPRVGKRFYALGEVRSVELRGPPKEYEPEEPDFDYAYLSESDD